MLKTLHINNYAIIDEVHIDFSSRLNVITGETGAGKSILMGALSLILGDRADSSVLLNREKKCIVEGVFSGNSAVLDLLREQELDAGDAEIIIRREIAANGKSRAFINDTPVNLEQLRAVSSLLVDLHRQFDTLSLADTAFQREVLDALAGNGELLKAYQQLFREWTALQSELRALEEKKSAFAKEYDYNKFLFDELEEAALKENELEEADAELKMLSHSETIKATLSQATDLLSGGDQPLVQQVKAVAYQLSAIEKYHGGLAELLGRLQSAQIELQDIADEVERLNDTVRHDPSRMEELNERIAIGYKLLKKHGVQTTSELLTIQRQLKEKLGAVLDMDDLMSQKIQEAEALKKQVDQLAGRLTAARAKQAAPLEKKVNQLLERVGMPNARLKVSMGTRLADISGADEIDFLFDANKSNRFEPIRKVASGGELSRLMLSIKSLVAESMDMPTLIFDEIDTGISGEAARQVGLIMQQLAANRQIITITHQPQIAGKGHCHLFVYKEMKKDVMRTHIRQLDQQERVTAIAKMLSGEKPTAAAIENAKELIGASA